MGEPSRDLAAVQEEQEEAVGAAKAVSSEVKNQVGSLLREELTTVAEVGPRGRIPRVGYREIQTRDIQGLNAAHI